MEHTGRLPR